MKTKSVAPILFFVLLLVLAVQVVAQDATPEATAAPTPAPVPWSDVLNFNNVILAAFVIGGVMGAVAAGGPLLMVINRIDKQTKDNAERLFLGLPPQWKEPIVKVVELGDTLSTTLMAAVNLLKQITDGKENEEPPKVE